MIESKTKVKKRIKELVQLINHWNNLYYNLNNSKVSDATYDQYFQELKKLEIQYPEFVFSDTPTKQIGFTPSSNFKKIQHSEPMLSLNNAFDKKDLYAFDKRINKITEGKHTYYCETKIDGLPVSLTFKNNYFSTAATRGDGMFGEDVTINVETINDINKIIIQKQLFQNFNIRGEVFISKNNFHNLNMKLQTKRKAELLEKISAKKKDLKNLILQEFLDCKFIEQTEGVLSTTDKKIIIIDNSNLLKKTSKISKNKLILEFKISFDNQNDLILQKFVNLFQNQNKFNLKNHFIQNNVLKLILNSSLSLIYDEFTNPRNTASGSLKQLNPEITSKRNLSIIFYNLIFLKNKKFTSQKEIIENLKKMHFPVSEYNEHCQNIEETFSYIEKITKIRDQIPYEIDGIVIKVNEHKFYPLIGRSERAPNHCVAFKYPSKIAETQIIDIFSTVGRTGRITYNAKLKTIFLSGTNVSAATLHNAEYIEKLDIRIGDFVYVKKAGEIIPKVVAVNEKKRLSENIKWKRDQTCPSCFSSLIIFVNEKDQYCLEKKCPEKKIQSFIHFANRNAMNIMGLNKSNIKTLIKLGFLDNFVDVYFLKTKYLQLLNLSNTTKLLHLGAKSINNLLNSIEATKKNSLERLLFGLNIRYVGSKAAKLLAINFQEVENLFNVTEEKLSKIEGFGPVLSKSIVNFFSLKQNKNLIINLKKLNINTKYYSKMINDHFFNHKKIVITGIFEWSRKNLINKLENCGANVLDSVSSSVDFLLVGNKPGNKLQKAKKLNIKLITTKKLSDLLQ